MEQRNSRSERIFDRAKLATPIIIFVAFTCLFYGPLSMYLPNAEELWFDLGILLRTIIPFSIFAIVLMELFFIILPEKAGSFFRKLLFGVALGFYIQGNWININYGSGVLDGSEIDWSKYTTYAVINSAIWVACIVLPFILPLLINKLREKISVDMVIIAASIFLTVIQLPAFAVQLFSYHPNESAGLTVTTDRMYELAEEDNIIYIILDAMDGEFYEEFIEQHPEYKEDFKGFTHYDNTFASGSRTMIGLPSMFTGKPFTRQNTYTEYLDDVWGGENAFSALYDSGYRVRVYSSPVTYSSKATEYVDNFILNTPQVSSYKKMLKKVYKLDLFRFLPHVFKKRFWFNTYEFNDAKKTIGSYKTNDSKFFEDYREIGFSVNGDVDKQFVLYHLDGAHKPYQMAADTSRVEKSTREAQVEGCFVGVKGMLDELKEKGLYDSSTIIISADHGDLDVQCRALLMIKEKNSSHDYEVSHVPVSMFDIGIYLAGLVGRELPDQTYGMKLSDLKEGMDRERHFFLNTSGNSRVIIQEYVTNDDVHNKEAVREVGFYEDPEGLDTPYELGTELSFARDATGNKYTVKGFSTNTGFRTILVGHSAEMRIPIANPPKEGDLNIQIKLNGLSKEVGPVIVMACGNKVLEEKIDANLIKEGLDFVVPVDSLEEGVLSIEFVFPDVPEDQPKKNTLSFVSMVIE